MDSSIDVPEESFSRPKDPGPTPFATTLQDKSTCIVSVFNLRTKELIQLVNSKFLNFSKNSPILNVNIIEDLLFWTDNRNQPRRININRAIEEPFHTRCFYRFFTIVKIIGVCLAICHGNLFNCMIQQIAV